jgi:hypothetical protein
MRSGCVPEQLARPSLLCPEEACCLRPCLRGNYAPRPPFDQNAVMSRSFVRRYIIASVVIEGLLWLLPGGKYGSASLWLVGSLGIVGSSWCFWRFMRLRGIVTTRPLAGTDRTEFLLLGLIVGALAIGLVVMKASGAASVIYATAAVVGSIWIALLPVMIVHARRKVRRGTRAM